jgi:hypothetical protein
MSFSLSLDSRYEQLLSSINQICALLDVATSVDLTELSLETIGDYLWILSDMANKTKCLCDALGKAVILF